MPNPFAGFSGFEDPTDGLIKGRDFVNGLFDTAARKQAGTALASGDYQSAAGLLGARGMIGDAHAILQAGVQQRKDALEQRRLADRAQIGASLLTPGATPGAAPDYQGAANKALAGGDTEYATSILSAAKEASGLQKEHLAEHNATLAKAAMMLDGAPPEKYDEGFNHVAEYLKSTGVDDAAIAATREQMRDPGARRSFIIAAQDVDKQLAAQTQAAQLAETHRHNVAEEGKPQWMAVPAGGELRNVKALGAGGGVASASPADGSPDAVWQSIIHQESGGRPGVTGPQTAYGRAQGMTQMLPATAQAMAQKLGVAWQPELMTGTTPEAAAYQQQLGRAYFDEGLQKYGGDVAKAAAYYHGGPDERAWGPKTRAYQEAVLARAGRGSGAVQPYQVASIGSTPAPPSSALSDPNVIKGPPLAQSRDLTPDELKARSLPEGTLAQIDPKGEISIRHIGEEDVKSGLSPEAIDRAARNYAITSQLPSLARGKAGNADKQAIINRSAELNGPDLFAAKAQYEGLKKASIEAASRKTAIRSASQKAIATMDDAIAFAEAHPNMLIKGGLLSPAAGVKALALGAMHDPDYTQFKNLLETAANEGAVAISNARSGTSTDAARRELQGRVNGGMTLAQLKGARAAMATEFREGVKSQDDTIADAQRQINQLLPPSSSSAPAAATRAAPPAVGALVKGYRFLGGDPAKPTSWRKAQ